MATIKDFDCNTFKRAAQESIYKHIQNMTPIEEIAWFKQNVESGPFGDLWKRISAKEAKTKS